MSEMHPVLVLQVCTIALTAHTFSAPVARYFSTCGYEVASHVRRLMHRMALGLPATDLLPVFPFTINSSYTDLQGGVVVNLPPALQVRQ
jgi:hypothetical protein